MDKVKAKFKRIYQERVLPQKSLIRNTPETFKRDLEILKEFLPYRERANELLLGGGENDEKR